MEPGAIPEQPGMNNENTPDFDLESAELSSEAYQTLQRVQIKYPDMAVEALVAHLDGSIRERYIQNLGEDTEAIKVWQALGHFLNENAGAVHIWLGERVPLDELMRDEGSDIEMDRFIKEREIPYIRKTFIEQPIILLDLLKGVKTEAAEISALSVLSEEDGKKLNNAIDKLVADRATSEEEARAILKRLQGK